MFSRMLCLELRVNDSRTVGFTAAFWLVWPLRWFVRVATLLCPKQQEPGENFGEKREGHNKAMTEMNGRQGVSSQEAPNPSGCS